MKDTILENNWRKSPNTPLDKEKAIISNCLSSVAPFSRKMQLQYDDIVCNYQKIKNLNFMQVCRKSICHSTQYQIQTLLRPEPGE